MDNINLASFKKRILSFSIDEFLISLVIYFVFIEEFLSAKTIEDIRVLTQEMIVPYILIKIIYHTLFVYYYQASIGKYICKIKCVNLQGERLNFYYSFLRAVFRIVSELFSYFGFLFGFFSPLKQTLHDKISKTLVINVE